MFLSRIILSSFILALISGCMTSHDLKISEVKLAEGCGFEQGAVFSNTPYYISPDKESAPIGGVSRLFDSYNRAIALVKITKSGGLLYARFYDQNHQEISTTNSSIGKEFDDDGQSLIINRWYSCRPGEAGTGCTWSRVELACTQDQDLSVKEVMRGAGGLVLIIPIFASMSYLGLYKRIQLPPTDN